MRSSGGPQLGPAVAAQRAEHVAGQAFRVHPDQDVGLPGHVAQDQGQVLLPVEHSTRRRRRVKSPSVGRDAGLGDPPHQLLRLPPVPDEVGDRYEREPVAIAEALELGQPGHRRLVLRDDLAEDAGRGQAGEPGQVDRGLGVAGPLEHATLPVAQGEDVARAAEVGGRVGGIDQRGDGGGPVGSRDPGRSCRRR